MTSMTTSPLNSLSKLANLTTTSNEFSLNCNGTECSTTSEQVNYYVGGSFDLDLYMQWRLVFTWLSLAVIIIGLFGNSISFIVLINPSMRTSTNVFLSSLCLSGFISLTGLLVNATLRDLLRYYGYTKMLDQITLLYPYMYPITNTFQMASILLTVCVSVNQFLCIYFAKASTMNNKNSNELECRRALWWVVVVFVFSIVYCVPYWLKYRINSNGKLFMTELNEDPLFNRIVHFYLYLPIAYIIPFSILIITNSYLISKLIIARRRRIRLGMAKQADGNKKRLRSGDMSSMTPSMKDDKDRRNYSKKRISLPVMDKRLVSTYRASSPAIVSKASASKLSIPTLTNRPVPSGGINLSKEDCINMSCSNINNPNQTTLNMEHTSRNLSLNGANLSLNGNGYLSNFNVNLDESGKLLKSSPDMAGKEERRMTILSNKAKKYASKFRSMNVTIMLIAVVMLFFLCQFPTLIVHIYHGLMCSKENLNCSLSVAFNYASLVCNFLITFNLSFNFACYCLFSQKFRQQLKQTVSYIAKVVTKKNKDAKISSKLNGKL